MAKAKNPKVFAYRRENGRVGIRNHVVILPLDDLSNSACEKVAFNVKGCKAIPHAYGRLQFGADLDLHFRTMIGTGANPNVAACVVIRIEPLWTPRIVDGVRATGKPCEGFAIEKNGDINTIAAAVGSAQYDEAFQMMDAMGKRLQENPPAWGKTLGADFTRMVSAFAEGADLPGETAFQVEAGHVPALRQFCALRALLAEYGPRAKEMRLLREWQQIQALFVQWREPNPGLLQYLGQKLDPLFQSSRQRVQFLAEKARNLGSEDPVKQRQALLAAMTLSAGMSRRGFAFDPEDFDAAAERVQTGFTVDGMKVMVEVPTADFGKTLRCRSGAYRFHCGWTPVLYRPVLWAARLAQAMEAAGVDPARIPSWRMIEGPGVPVALNAEEKITTCFFRGELHNVIDVATEGEQDLLAFRKAAEALNQGFAGDEKLSRGLRMALGHVLSGTYGPLDPEDYLSGDFCRRVIAGPYLERHVPDLEATRQAELKAFRDAFTRVSAGRKAFYFKQKDGARVTALRPLDIDLGQEALEGGDQDANTPLQPPPYNWSIENADGTTTFGRSLPERQIYPMFLLNTYAGRHEMPPAGEKPVRAEVVHAVDGLLAACDPATGKLEGEEAKWNASLAGELAGVNRPDFGPPGWGFPIHVPICDGRDQPLALVTRYGLLESPDFAAEQDADARRAAQDAWLDACAKVLNTPGDLSLFFRHLARYCLDSPISADPGLIGRKKATGEFHQTVYQMLDRKVAGHFIGDCDDLAEFYQVVTQRQGKNSQVFHLPGHAACGYVDQAKAPEGQTQYSLIFLQTGPAQIFTGTDLYKTVEAGVRSFDRQGMYHFNPEGVGFLLRFANEQTRTPYRLSATILVDPEYAKTMIRVQSYWHYHYYSTALREMEPMVVQHPTPGNYNEVFGLYRMVGLYDKALEVFEESRRAVKEEDEMSRLSNILEAAEVCLLAKDAKRALGYIGEIEAVMQKYFQARNLRAYMAVATMRMACAGMLAHEKEFVRAAKLITLDLELNLNNRGTLPDPLINTLAGIYGAIREEEEKGKSLAPEVAKVRDDFARILQQCFARGFFLPEDDFNRTLGRYGLLGFFAIAQAGRKASVEKLTANGPYPEGDREHEKRGAEITDADWQWFRICPSISWSLAAEMLDPEEKDTYDPKTALQLLDAMRRGYGAAVKAELGSLNLMDSLMLIAALRKAFLEKDHASFARLLKQVRERDWSDYYESAAEEFGASLGLIPLKDASPWIETFHASYPGKQYYFRAVYAAVGRKHYEHAVALAEATVKYFPDVTAMADEAAALRPMIEKLRERDAKMASASGGN